MMKESKPPEMEVDKSQTGLTVSNEKEGGETWKKYLSMP